MSRLSEGLRGALGNPRGCWQLPAAHAPPVCGLARSKHSLRRRTRSHTAAFVGRTEEREHCPSRTLQKAQASATEAPCVRRRRVGLAPCPCLRGYARRSRTSCRGRLAAAARRRPIRALPRRESQRRGHHPRPVGVLRRRHTPRRAQCRAGRRPLAPTQELQRLCRSWAAAPPQGARPHAATSATTTAPVYLADEVKHDGTGRLFAGQTATGADVQGAGGRRCAWPSVRRMSGG